MKLYQWQKEALNQGHLMNITIPMLNKPIKKNKNKVDKDFKNKISNLLSITSEKKQFPDYFIKEYIFSYGYGNGTRAIQTFLSLFNFVPDSMRLSDDVYNILKIREHLVSIGYKILEQDLFTFEGETSIGHSFLVDEKNKSLIYLQRTKTNSDNIELGHISIHFDSRNKEEIENLIHKIHSDLRIEIARKNEIYLIVLEDKQLRLKNFEIKDINLDLEIHYGKNFLEVHEKLIQDLNDPFGKGIALLYSEPGCGKTTYIRYLIKLIENKKVIYIPPNLAEEISSPQFLSFLMDHTNSILIIEDAENIIRSRETSGYTSQAVQNLLNLSDGILGDILKIQIIATFNTDKSNIDQALLRDGRLIAEHQFKKLSIEDSQKLSDHLQLDTKIEKEMNLSEIYNQKNKSIRNVNEKSTIGFKSGRKN